jgi:hypothetical protein
MFVNREYVTLRGEHKLRVNESGELKWTFGSETEEVRADSRRLIIRSYMIYNPRQITYYSDDRTQENKMVGYFTRLGENKNAYRILVRENERMKAIGRPKHRWENNIKRDKK